MSAAPFNMHPVDETKIESLLAQMTQEEKTGMCHACDQFASGGVPRLGIPRLEYSDGPHGVREEIAPEGWASAQREDDYATYLPTGTAMAATWNPEMGALFGSVLGTEARKRGKDVILGPGINIVRTPLGGRTFEYFSEDPYLIRRLVVPVVRAIQAEDTAACVKHYALNNQELDRHGSDVEVSERALREIYLPGFKAAVTEGGAATIMSSYNLFRGQHCSHHKYLLKDILKGEWGFQGLVVSDWGGVYDTREAAENGLDVEMGTHLTDYAQYHLSDAYRKALTDGTCTEEDLNDKVRRILRVMMATGLVGQNRKPGAFGTDRHHQATRTLAREAIVLLKNEGPVLPFDLVKIKKLAVIGEKAIMHTALGGGSSEVKAPYEVTCLDGIKEACGEKVEVTFVDGYPDKPGGIVPVDPSCLGTVDDGSGIKGWNTKFYPFNPHDHTLLFSRTDQDLAFEWDRETSLPENLRNSFQVEFTSLVTVPAAGTYRFAATSNESFELRLDGKSVFDMIGNVTLCTRHAELDLEQGQQVAVHVIHRKFNRGTTFRFGWVKPGTDTEAASSVDRAIAAARSADAVVFVGGLDKRFDTEGRDRTDLKIPDGQDALIPKIAAANPNLAVCLIGGSAMEMPWIDDVPAALMVWYAGMEIGHALADILFGTVNPSGKLPVTFPKQLADTPAAAVGDYQTGKETYHEGIFVGYRWYDAKNIAPLFPFGHGLSYTSFEYKNLTAETDNELIRVSFTLANTGPRDGAETAQVYIGKKDSNVERAVRELKGFEKVFLAVGEKKTVSIDISRDELAYFNESSGAWVTEPGEYTVSAGGSSRDLRQDTTFIL